jgi:hypothetical protein
VALNRRNVAEDLGVIYPPPSSPLYLDVSTNALKIKPLLYSVEGRRGAILKLIPPPLSSIGQSLTSNSYLFDAGDRIVQFNGAQTSRLQRARAMELAGNIKYLERGGAVKLETYDEADADATEFLKIVGLEGMAPRERSPSATRARTASVAADEGGSDFKMSIFRIRDEEEPRKAIAMAWEGGRCERTILNSEFAFVVKTGGGEIFLWTGKAVTKRQRAMGEALVVALQRQRDATSIIALLSIKEGLEPALFKVRGARGLREDSTLSFNF